MQDKQYLENYLLVLKATTEVYVHGTIESSNEMVRLGLKNGLNETLTNQAKTYDIMKENGWYQTNNISNEEINCTLNKLENMNL